MQNFRGNRDSDTWRNLWTIAVQIDFKVADASSQGDAGVVRLLHSDDIVEIGLRRLSSHVYLDRTGDETGAMRIMGVVPPGSAVDLAPTWLVDDATAHSKMEWQRAERVLAERKRHKGKDGKDKGGKGKDKKGKGGGAAPSH